MQSSFLTLQVISPPEHGDAYDDRVAGKGQGCRELSKKEGSKDRSEDDLGVIKYGDLFGRSVFIGGCYPKLADRCRQTGHDKAQ